MSIEEKISDLLKESETAENVTEEVTEESKKDDAITETTEVVEESTEEEKEELKIDISSDVDKLVEGEDLSDEFKTKAAAIFEATVVTRVQEEISKLNEDFDKRLEEGVNEKIESIVEKVDGYLDYCVEKWISDNEVALESGIKTDITENFINKMKTAFAESYIDVPAEKLDLVEELTKKAESLEAQLSEAIETSIEATKKLDEQKIDALIMEKAEGLSEVDTEKFGNLAKDLVFEDVESYSEKLNVIRETYFKAAKTSVDSVVSEETTDIKSEEATKKSTNPNVSGYAAALDRLK